MKDSFGYYRIALSEIQARKQNSSQHVNIKSLLGGYFNYNGRLVFP
jgi:hypothetical protein